MELRERPTVRLKFAPVSKPYVLLWKGELVAIYPLAERENTWVILKRLLKWRDLCCAQKPYHN
jgi:hypothetical protein